MNMNSPETLPVAKRRRRGVDWTVLVKIVAMLPSVLVGMVIVLLVAAIIVDSIPALPAWTQWVPLGAAVLWFLLGFLWFVPGTQSVIARYFFHFRQPVNAEQRYMEHSWHEVLRRAGIPGRTKYRLWMDDTDDLNAAAAGGTIVAVTRGALRYNGEHLGAILAHELGHHLNGHTYPGLLAWWYGRPLAMVRFLARMLLRFALGVVRVISYLNALVAFAAYITIGLTYLGILYGIVQVILWAWEQSWVAVVVLALAIILGPVMNRQAEYRADKMAAQLGYGPALVDVFREWQALGFDDHHGRRGVRALYLASHPPLHARIRKIEKRLTSSSH